MVVVTGDPPPPPAWMGPWLNTPMYGESCRCEIHRANYTTVTCGKCMGRPHCQACWEATESIHHPGHEPILQVYIASRRLAIRVESISAEWDISDVQIYTINGHEVLHLDTNGNSTSPVRKNAKASDEIPKCRKCKRKIKESKYCFCSIACKYYHITSLDGLHRKVTEDKDIVMQSPTLLHRKVTQDKDVVMQSPTLPLLRPRPTLRRRSRKGIPSRAPFF